MAKDFSQSAREAAGGKDEREARLLAALQAEEAQAVGYDTDATVTEAVNALDRYFGKPYGDEVSGRSQITTREIQETVSWLVPDLLDIFAAGGRICDVKPQTKAAVQANPEQRADYLNYVFFEDNPGVLLLYDFIWDSLVNKRAYADVDWNDRPSYSGWQTYENLTQLHVEELIAQQDVELKDLEETQVAPSEAYPQGMAYNVKARRFLEPGLARIEIVPPEDMFVAGRAVELCTARYKGRLLRWRRAEWKRQFPEFKAEIDEGQGQDNTVSIEGDERRQARFDDGRASFSEWAVAANKDAEELIGRKEYIYWADDGEEEEKLYRVYRLGDLILEVEEVDDDPFASATSHRIPHRLQGLSIPDLLGDLQKLKTVLTRALVDGTMQANVPRMGAKDGVNLDDLLNLDHGAIIRTGQMSPGEALMPIVLPDLTPSTLKALEWTNQIIEQRTGVSRHAQGLDPDSLNHTARGIQLLQNAANGVKRMIARLIAVGVEEMITKLDRVIMRHQKQDREVELSGEWVKVSPMSWHPAMKIKVGVGLGTGSKEAQLQFLQMIQQDQMTWVSAYGPQTPVVTPEHLHHTVSEKLRVMGYASPDQFFGRPVIQNPQTGQMEPFVPQTPPSPDQQKVQAQIQEGQARLQMDGMKAQQDAQLQAQTAQADATIRKMEADAKVATDAQKAQLDAEVAQMKAQAEIQIMRERMASEMQMKAQQMAFEAQMKERQFQFEMQMAEREFELKERMAEKQAAAKMNGNANGSSGGVSSTQFGGDPG